MTFPTDYQSIIERIKNIDPIHYGSTRNFTDGAVTYLSPYVSRGVISVKQINDITLARGFNAGAIQRLTQELTWREYFQRVWQVKGDSLFEDIKQSQTSVSHHQMIESILKATTGINAIDRSIEDFYKTGYLHNHVRMYLASITCNIGQAHWFVPSFWMYANLLDGDLASNICSWQWVAGTFSSKKYYCNQENINRFTNSFQQNTFLDTAVENLSATSVPTALKSVTSWELKAQLPFMPKPSIDVTKPTLIYNSYNLDPLWRKNDDVNRVLLLEPSHFKKFPVSGKVIDFVTSLCANIKGIQILVGEVFELTGLYNNAFEKGTFISKEHPAFTHYPGTKDERDWIYPAVTGYYPSFSAFWKQCASTSRHDKLSPKKRLPSAPDDNQSYPT